MAAYMEGKKKPRLWIRKSGLLGLILFFGSAEGLKPGAPRF
jgi:hypothetical protein